ncbi:MAG TPA: TetR/AcrR family transcriptional regulator [Polyangiaceae bacterium]|jgi:AcrR family transcriptional regulator|nr:TetR/AcrR family transcriptional regulator [Polyangiaceae bacterium]
MKMRKNPAPPASRGRPRLFEDVSDSDTKGKILEAAFRKLASSGYASLSIREIAKDAGVNHALINYHFHTKDQLVVEVLDAANRRLLERQRRMYDTPGGFAEKWAQARRFYEHDLASGFVRVQAELWAASFSNPGLREKFVPRVEAWREVVLGGVRDALRTLEESGASLPPPFTAEAITCWISEFWLGMEFSNLLGTGPEHRRYREALDAMEHLLKYVDGLARKPARVPTRPVRRRPSHDRRDA